MSLFCVLLVYQSAILVVISVSTKSKYNNYAVVFKLYIIQLTDQMAIMLLEDDFVLLKDMLLPAKTKRCSTYCQ